MGLSEHYCMRPAHLADERDRWYREAGIGQEMLTPSPPLAEGPGPEGEAWSPDWCPLCCNSFRCDCDPLGVTDEAATP